MSHQIKITCADQIVRHSGRLLFESALVLLGCEEISCLWPELHPFRTDSLSISPMPFNCCSVVRSNEQGHFCMEIQQKLIKAERESLLCSDERKAFSPLFNNHPFNSREEQTRAMLCGCLLILFCISISQDSYFINLTFFTICHFSFWCLSCSFSLAVQS